MKEKIQGFLQERRILSAKGTVKKGQEMAYSRVQKLINLHPKDPAWVEGVARTAFRPNTQHSSFLDACQERGIVDENYIPVDEETYQELRDQWEDLPYESVPLKRIESFMDEALQDNGAPQAIFLNDDSEPL